MLLLGRHGSNKTLHMILLYINICITSIYGYYIMALYVHQIEMLEHIQKYFGDFYDFISCVIEQTSWKYQTCEGFCEALYVNTYMASGWCSQSDGRRVGQHVRWAFGVLQVL